MRKQRGKQRIKCGCNSGNLREANKDAFGVKTFSYIVMLLELKPVLR